MRSAWATGKTLGKADLERTSDPRGLADDGRAIHPARRVTRVRAEVPVAARLGVNEADWLQ